MRFRNWSHKIVRAAKLELCGPLYEVYNPHKGPETSARCSGLTWDPEYKPKVKFTGEEKANLAFRNEHSTLFNWYHGGTADCLNSRQNQRSSRLKRGAYENRCFTGVWSNMGKNRKAMYYIFRAWITVNGVRLYAKDYGYKAWRIPVYR